MKDGRFLHASTSFVSGYILSDLHCMNETYRKELQIFVMKNYAALIAKLQSRNLPLPRDYFAMSALLYTCYIGCDWHNFNMAMGQKRYKRVFTRLYLCNQALFRQIP